MMLYTIRITLQYLSDLEKYKHEKPFHLTQLPGQEESEFTNLEYSTRSEISLHDARGHESEFTLDTHSFAFVRVPSQVVFDKTDAADDQYVRETIELIRERFGAERVICYDIRVRFLPTSGFTIVNQ
jgi:hypothetical protein